ncbi:hypothetical protein BC833DRAFT_658378 [Globomyces pollinis-pini]|nr:hypothetical protein BC833DRAFT_658378 [Globomyces pollinis-pini]
MERVQWGTGGTNDFEGDFGDFKGGTARAFSIDVGFGLIQLYDQQGQHIDKWALLNSLHLDYFTEGGACVVVGISSQPTTIMQSLQGVGNDGNAALIVTSPLFALLTDDTSVRSLLVGQIYYSLWLPEPCIVLTVNPRHVMPFPEEPPSITIVLITGFSGKPVNEVMAEEEFKRVHCSYIWSP